MVIFLLYEISKKIIKKTDSLEKDEKKLLKMDRKNDKIVDKAKKKMKEKC